MSTRWLITARPRTNLQALCRPPLGKTTKTAKPACSSRPATVTAMVGWRQYVARLGEQAAENNRPV